MLHNNLYEAKYFMDFIKALNKNWIQTRKKTRIKKR